jgi:hypothetical protein
MIFDVDSSQIEKLDSNQLVELLKKLLYAEAQRAGISLRGVSVPLQITIPDGGEDARISWEGGLEQTDYLPSRFCVFQSKATKASSMGREGWKKEVRAKASQKKEEIRELNDAVKDAIENNGSYIGFTSGVLIKSKIYKDRIDGIKEGIREAGANPDRLKSIDIYDANKIAGWASKHPAVAVWLNEKQSGLNLRGFQTLTRLGERHDIESILQVEDKKSRFSIGSENIASKNSSITFDRAKERIADYLSEPKKAVRIVGSSGVGKTRFLYEALRDEATIGKVALATSAMYCDFRYIGNQIFQIVQSLSETGNSALVIVDECSRDTAINLGNITANGSSNLRLITIGNDNQSIDQDSCLNISVLPADDTLIEGIIKQRHPKADYSEINFIKNLSDGYPRIAVLATDNSKAGAPILKSVEDIVERVLIGCGINRVEQVRAIECLALFKQLGADDKSSSEIDFVAENLARQTGDEMYEHLAHATKQHLVDRRGSYFIAQPIPIAAFLGARRLDLLRVNTILDFIENSSSALRESFLSQWCHFDGSRTASMVAQQLLAGDGWCGSLEGLNTELGSQCLSAIVHIDPDRVTDAIRYVYGNLSIDDLKSAEIKNRNLVEVLKILVFRKRSFDVVAPIMMRLAAVENRPSFSNAASRFNQLFQLYLSGTEADPSERFEVLDLGISSGEDRIISICIEALENTLKRRDFTGFASLGRIGSQPPLKNWEPKTWDEIFDFHINGLQRLTSIRVRHLKFSDKCENIIAAHIRSLLSCTSLFDKIEDIIKDIVKEKGIWLEAIKGVGDWLYFDRTKAPEEFSKKVRNMYDRLIPIESIQKALLYTKFWSSNIHDPDLSYDMNIQSTQDFKYSSRKAQEVAAEIASDKEIAYRAIRTMVKEELNDIFPFTDELAKGLEDPIEAFQIAVTEFEISNEQNGIQFIRGLITGIDKIDPKAANECIQIALKSDALKTQTINIHSAARMSVERLSEITQSVKERNIPAIGCVYFSYGKGLDNLSAENISPLVDELASNHGAEGIWTALEIISMYRHDQESVNDFRIQWIKKLTTSPELFEKTRSSGMDGYLLDRLILLVYEHHGIDDNFATGISNQIVKLCQVKDSNIFHVLDSYCQNIIGLLVKEKPIIIWKVLSRFFEVATSLEIFYLTRLVGSPQDTFDGESQNKAGTLFGVSDADCISWAKIRPEIRSPFLCTFYPVTEIDSAGNNQWHPALATLTHEFGAIEEFRTALARRLSPSSWSGSIIPHFETYLKLLATWFDHPIPEMSQWAKNVSRQLERQIEIES